jgi:putative nucleotidyltransferase with HDIG domain
MERTFAAATAKVSLPTAYIAGVALLGAVLLFASSLTIGTTLADPFTVLLLAGLAAGAQRMPVFLFRNSAVSVAFAATIATYVLYGTGIALWVNLAAAAVNAFTPKRKPFEKVAFNTGALTISAFAASTTYQLVGGQVPPGSVVPTILAVAISSLVYFAVNSALTGTVIALTTGQRFYEIYRENYSWMVVNWLATGINGAALALAYQSLQLFGAVAFIMPLAVSWYSFKLYMAKSKELRKRNEELETVNRTLEMTNVTLEGSHLSVIGALVGALEAKDKHTQGHSTATMLHAVSLARKFGLSEEDVTAIQLGALFHDIGKIGIPEQILCKPGALTPEEWNEMREHSTIGANLLAHVPTLERVRPIVEAHHERYDGTGYPHQLKGDDIPLEAQIVALADSFAAMTATRAYRPAMSKAAALAELRRSKGTQFAPAVVESFVAMMEDEARGVTQAQAVQQPAFVTEAVGIHPRAN